MTQPPRYSAIVESLMRQPGQQPQTLGSFFAPPAQPPMQMAQAEPATRPIKQPDWQQLLNNAESDDDLKAIRQLMIEHGIAWKLVPALRDF